MISVRQLRAGDDLTHAITLLRRFFREEGFDTPEDVIANNTRTMASLDVCGLFQAETDGVAIGVATVSLEYGIEFGWSAEMGDLYVVPTWRGRGASRALVNAVEVFLRAKGAAGYQVTVTPFAQEHHDLNKFYDKMGFDNEGRMILHRTLK